jgi:hypothetical protein
MEVIFLGWFDIGVSIQNDELVLRKSFEINWLQIYKLQGSSFYVGTWMDENYAHMQNYLTPFCWLVGFLLPIKEIIEGRNFYVISIEL